jgi:hypothetical protein
VQAIVRYIFKQIAFAHNLPVAKKAPYFNDGPDEGPFFY